MKWISSKHPVRPTIPVLIYVEEQEHVYLATWDGDQGWRVGDGDDYFLDKEVTWWMIIEGPTAR